MQGLHTLKCHLRRARLASRCRITRTRGFFASIKNITATLEGKAASALRSACSTPADTHARQQRTEERLISLLGISRPIEGQCW
jgi:hypothetical protein